MLRAKVTCHSQSDVLRIKMAKAGFTHERKAIAHLRNVRVRRQTAFKGVIYFCEMKGIEPVQDIQPGDGNPLPEIAKTKNIVFPEEGIFDLKNVMLYPNGHLQVIATEETRARTPGWNPLRRYFSLS